MKKISIYVLFIITLCIWKPNLLTAQVNVQDSLALVDLYANTRGGLWRNNTNWLTNNPLSTWFGISVSANRVTQINLTNNVLRGKLPSSLGNLTELKVLELSDNLLSDTIPSSLGDLINLTVLNLSDNQFRHDILNGSIPASLGNLTNLSILNLSHNRGLAGSIPASLGNLSNLTVLNLSYDFNLIGNIPSSLGNLTNLTVLDLSHIHLKGNIPSSLGNLTNLQHLGFSDAHNLTGHIPESFANLVNLDFLDLANNRLAGPVPAFLGNLTNLTDLSLSQNKFSGSIPGSLGNLTKLVTLNLAVNRLSGEIPFALSNLTSLTRLDLAVNQLSGRIPSFVGNFKSLTYLNLSHNQFIERIPSSFGSLVYLRYLYLSYNQLSDTIPLTLAKIAKNLFNLNLEYNKFTFAGMGRLASAMDNNLDYYSQAIVPLHKNGNTLSLSVGSIPYHNTYKWKKDGVLYKTKVGDSTLHVTTSGAYYVKVTNSVAKGLTLYSDTIYITDEDLIVAQTSELNINNKLSSLNIYPNPAKTNATLLFNADGKYTITIATVSGKILQTKTGVAIKGINIIQLDVSKYASGIYLVTIANEKNKKQTLRLNKE